MKAAIIVAASLLSASPAHAPEPFGYQNLYMTVRQDGTAIVTAWMTPDQCRLFAERPEALVEAIEWEGGIRPALRGLSDGLTINSIRVGETSEMMSLSDPAAADICPKNPERVFFGGERG